MNKKIITELNRNLEIMGMAPLLLIESTIFDEIISLAKPIFTTAAEKFSVSKGKNIFIGTEEVSKELFKKFQKVINNPSKLVNLTSRELSKLYRILATDETFVNQVYQKGVRDFMKRYPQYTEKDIVKRVMSYAKDNNKTIKQSLDYIFNDEFLVTVLTDKYVKKIDDLKLNRFVDEVTPIVDDIIEPGWKGFVNNFVLPMWAKYYKSLIPYLTKTDDQLIALANQRLGIIKEKLSRVPPVKIHADLEQLFVILNARKKWNTWDIDTGFQKYLKNNSDLPQNQLEEFLKRPEVVEVMENQSKQASSVVKDMFVKRMEAFLDQIPGISLLQDIIKKGAKEANYAKFFGNFKRLASTIVWKNPQLPSEAVSQAMIVGTKSHMLGVVTNFIVFELVIQPTIIASLKILFENEGIINTLNDNIDTIKDMCAQGILKDCPEDIEELKNLNVENWKDAYLESLPFFSMAYNEENPRNTISENAVLSQFTLLDEFTNIIMRLYKSSAFGPGVEVEANRMANEYIKAQHEELYDELVRRGLDPNGGNDIISVLDRLKQTSAPTPNNVTIENFYDYLHGLNNLIGVDDLPYMKQDSTNKNMFTFDACLNPPDCNRIEKRTYIYNGTTFVQR